MGQTPQTPPISGSCFCKAVRVRIDGPAVLCGHCHCTDCQKFSGTGHASGLVFATTDVHVSGETTSFRYRTDSGNHLTRHFCPVCGVQVYHTNDNFPQSTSIAVSVLDDPAFFQPAFAIFTDSAQPWDAPDTTLRTFARMPVREAGAGLES